MFMPPCDLYWPSPPNPLQVIAVCKSADLLLMVLDATKPWTHREILTRELEAVGMRLNRDPPNIYWKKKKTGERDRGRRRLSLLDAAESVLPCLHCHVHTVPQPMLSIYGAGGISVNSTLPLTHLDDKMITGILQQVGGWVVWQDICRRGFGTC